MFAAHGLAVFCYLVGAAAGSASRRLPGLAAAVPWLLGVGILAQGFAFFEFHKQVPPIPLESFSASLSLIGALFAASYLLSLGVIRIRGIGPWVATAALFFTLVADLGLRFLPTQVGRTSAGAWPHAHVLLSTAGFSLLALASVAGLAYLVKERALKRKRGLAVPLPSLESLDRTESIALAIGFPLLTLGVATGFLWASTWGHPLWTGHAVFLLGAWIVYLLPVGQRILRNQRGPQPARAVVLGFAVLLVSYVGVRLIGGGA